MPATHSATSEELVEQFATLFDALKTRNRWAGPTMLRIAALSLVGVDGDDAAASLTELAETLRKKAKWAGPLNSSLRLVLAGMIMRRRLDAMQVVESTRQTLDAFKAHRLGRGGTRRWVAALLMVVQNNGQPPHQETVQRMAAIIKEWKKDHPWLTQVDDYPMAALHAARSEEPAVLSHRVESIYQALRRARFGIGDQLQLASHLLAVGELGGDEAAARFSEIATALRQRKVRIGRSRYDEVALLSLAPGPADDLATEAVDIRDRLCRLKAGFLTGRIPRELGLSMAVAMLLDRLAREQQALGSAAETSVLVMGQTALEAAQAAAIAAIAGGAVAATSAAAAASSSG